MSGASPTGSSGRCRVHAATFPACRVWRGTWRKGPCSGWRFNSDPVKSADLSRYRDNLQGQIDSAALYRALSGIERKPELSDVYRRLAEVEETHARFWSRKIAEQGQQPPPLNPNWRTRILIW